MKRRGMPYLQLSQVLWPLVDVHASETDANSAGRDDDDAVASLLKLDGSVDDEGQDGQQRLMRLFIDDGACACQGRDSC